MVRYFCQLILAKATCAAVALNAFQVNRDGQKSTEERRELPPERLLSDSTTTGAGDDNRTSNRWYGVIETVLIFLCFALFSGQLPPDVNESHYLTKAKHFWNPNWCPNDIFLSSSFAHWVFFAGTGWLTKFMSLSAYAWVGRIITWFMIALAWRQFSHRVIPKIGIATVSALTFLLLNERFHLAGEWVVGGFEAKGFAYAFVLIALRLAIERKWDWAFPAIGAAMAFHVLVGGWALLAMLFARVVLWRAAATQRKNEPTIFDQLKSNVLPMVACASLGLIGALPPLLADQSASAEMATSAHLIYVNQRISHHLTFGAFPTIHVARFLILIVFFFMLNRWLQKNWLAMHQKASPLFWFSIGSLLISFGGLLLSGIAEQEQTFSVRAASMLRFYWFRLADFAVPTYCAITCGAIISFWLVAETRQIVKFCSVVFLMAITAAAGVHVVQKYQDPRPRADRRSLPTYDDDPQRTIDTYQNWRKVCQWIKTNTPPEAVFITPDQQQTFKWYAGRTEVVSWKDVPQDASSIIQWQQRLIALHDPQRLYESGLMSFSDEQLRSFAEEFGADYLVVPQRQVDMAAEPSELTQVYPVDPTIKSTYVVFKF